MRLPDPRNIVIMAILIVVAFFFLRRLWKILIINLRLVAEVLHGEIEYPFLNLPVYFVVKGMYKGRRIICYCNPLGRRYGDSKFCIEPNNGLQDSSFFSLPKDGPIDGTYIVGHKIYCEEPISSSAAKSRFRRSASLLSHISREDLINYLDQLCVAAERVEKAAYQTTSVS